MVSSQVLPDGGDVYRDYQELCKKHRPGTELHILEILRKRYPGYHVVCASQSDCDLLGYAEAGLAVVELDADDENLDFSRGYKSPDNRLEEKPGILKDDVRFGRFRYSWKGRDFILYKISHTRMSDWAQELLFVLSRRTGDKTTTSRNTAIDELLLDVGTWTGKIHEEIFVFDDGYWQKSSSLWKSIQRASWDDVILDSKTKQSLIQDVDGFFDNRKLYAEFSVPWKRGLIFHGLPGNGKTLSIKALMNALSARPGPVPSLYVKALDKSCGTDQSSIQSIFQHARVNAPCLLVFEDLDSLITDETRSYFLNEVDGLESNDGILMIGSTNHLEKLDSAISNRPSRFDRKYYYKLPDHQMRSDYCQYWRKKLESNKTIGFPSELCPVIASLTDGFTFAYLNELFVTTLLAIARGDQSIKEAIEGANGEYSSTPGPESDSKHSDNLSIPEGLEENVVFKVIRAQVKILVSEMGNSESESKTAEEKVEDKSSN
ncbi:uncharacterized protein K452DRAFT_320160 [Aplosporella prunicola CBS 121167]|uniref:AAA+ ATPase domain-containing protein n=1 Tax=Aplosporella prunicola CBS 121167 TaxID=1176127 RepID=A0A6A6B9A8_9PEZI|nr:uncharacterized protein K452DRAFT_320160 [Aplosporella prunicola CBS 121167]KAF2139487.1 hypothetical protein K452DRAFT_320160 [Aplosporella prunicola CBS 121167]